MLDPTRVWRPDEPNPYAPAPTQMERAARTERRWLDTGTPNRPIETLRARLESATHRYATTSTLIAATLKDVCTITIPDGATPRANGGAGPSRPTESHALTRIHRTDQAMRTWAHCLTPCPLCPAPDRPHDEPVTLAVLVDVDCEAAGRLGHDSASIMRRRTRTLIDDVNQAQQLAAGSVVVRFDACWSARSDLDELRAIADDFAAVARRAARVATTIGARA